MQKIKRLILKLFIQVQTLIRCYSYNTVKTLYTGLIVKLNISLVKFPWMITVLGWGSFLGLRFSFGVFWDFPLEQSVAQASWEEYPSSSQPELSNEQKYKLIQDRNNNKVEQERWVVEQEHIKKKGMLQLEQPQTSPVVKEAEDFLIRLTTVNKEEVPGLIIERLINNVMDRVEQMPSEIVLDHPLLKNIVFNSIKEDPARTFWITPDVNIYLNPESLQYKLTNSLSLLVHNTKNVSNAEKELYLHLITQINLFNLAAIKNIPFEQFIYNQQAYEEMFNRFAQDILPQ